MSDIVEVNIYSGRIVPYYYSDCSSNNRKNIGVENVKESLFEWIRNVAYYMILVTAVMHVVPKGNYQKYIRLFTGMILILLLSSPILKLFGVEQEQVSLINIEEYQDKLNEINNATMYLYEIDASSYVMDEEEANIDTEDIKIGKIKIGE